MDTGLLYGPTFDLVCTWIHATWRTRSDEIGGVIEKVNALLVELFGGSDVRVFTCTTQRLDVFGEGPDTAFGDRFCSMLLEFLGVEMEVYGDGTVKCISTDLGLVDNLFAPRDPRGPLMERMRCMNERLLSAQARIRGLESVLEGRTPSLFRQAREATKQELEHEKQSVLAIQVDLERVVAAVGSNKAEVSVLQRISEIKARLCLGILDDPLDVPVRELEPN